MIEIEVWTILVQGISFLVLIFALNSVMYKPILKFVQERDQRIADAQKEVGDLNQKVEQKAADYEKALMDAKNAAVDERNALLAVGAEKAKGIIDAARGEIPAMMEKFYQQLNEDLESGRKTLRGQLEKISTEVVAKVLVRSV